MIELSSAPLTLEDHLCAHWSQIKRLSSSPILTTGPWLHLALVRSHARLLSNLVLPLQAASLVELTVLPSQKRATYEHTTHRLSIYFFLLFWNWGLHAFELQIAVMQACCAIFCLPGGLLLSELAVLSSPWSDLL